MSAADENATTRHELEALGQLDDLAGMVRMCRDAIDDERHAEASRILRLAAGHLTRAIRATAKAGVAARRAIRDHERTVAKDAAAAWAARSNTDGNA